MMKDVVDARGFSCPVPVVLAKNRMSQAGSGEFEMLVDTDTSRENVSRMARHNGWSVTVEEEGTDYRLTLKKV